MKNKRLIILLMGTLLGGYTELFGQIQRMEKGTDVSTGVIGIVRESNGTPISYAHIFFIQGRDTIKMAADENGYFTYRGNLTNPIRLEISAIGYKKFSELYMPRMHGRQIEVVLEKEVISLKEARVVGKRHRNMEVFHLRGSFKINDQDTMFTGVCHRDDKQWIHKYYIYDGMGELRRCWQFNFTENDEKEMLDLRERLKNLSTFGEDVASQESKRRIQALKSHIAELEALPDQNLKETARAKGQTVSEFRKETIKNLQNLMKLIKKQNSQAYIDNISYWANIRLSELKNKKEYSHLPWNVATKYKFKEKMAHRMVDSQLHNYREALGWFTHGLGAVARRKYHPIWKKEMLAWGFVNHNSQEIIPCQYGWVLNNKPRKTSLEETDPILHQIMIVDSNNNTLLDHFSQDTLWQSDFPYTDQYGWITVGDFMNPNLMGMIDQENKVMIPLKFIRREERHEWIEFFETTDGDFAAVTIWKNGKLQDGLIDRQGNFTLKPTYETPIYFHKGRKCFYTNLKTDKNAKTETITEKQEKNRIYFNAFGQIIKE